jgi:hypothetical protein
MKKKKKAETIQELEKPRGSTPPTPDEERH